MWACCVGCVANGGGLEHGPSFPKLWDVVWAVGGWAEAHGLLRHGLCMCSGSYQAGHSFPNDQTCCIGAGNVESRP